LQQKGILVYIQTDTKECFIFECDGKGGYELSTAVTPKEVKRLTGSEPDVVAQILVYWSDTTIWFPPHNYFVWLRL
jgi:hypothetical protein